MISSILQRLVAVSFLFILSGCVTANSSPPSQASVSPSVRNNCYSLLYQLLDEEKDVNKLHFIKREETPVQQLLKRISIACDANAKMLKQFAKNDPSLNLNDIGLPPGESATRDAIAKTKKHDLLSQKGDEFELSLLLSQFEALNYGRHLAVVARANETNPQRVRGLAVINEQLDKLYQEVFSMLLSRPRPSTANSAAFSKR